MVEISYVKRNTASFCRNVCRVAYEDRGTAIGRRDLWLADGLSDLGRVRRRGAEHFAPGKTNPVVGLLIFIEPRDVEDPEAGNRPSGYAGDCNFDG